MRTLKRPATTITNVRFEVPKTPMSADAKLVIAAYVALVLSATLCLYVIHGGF
jgi:hypothetical protein